MRDWRVVVDVLQSHVPTARCLPAAAAADDEHHQQHQQTHHTNSNNST